MALCSVVWPLAITTITMLKAHNPAAFREDGIIKPRTSINSARRSCYINSSLLNENSVNIRLALGKDLTHGNII
jgi:hypothetical protein